MIVQVFLYLLTGFFAGLMSGILGIGGGVIIVPSLLFIFQKLSHFPTESIMLFASATSLALILFTSLVALKAHYILGGLPWPVLAKLWKGLVLGSCSGVLIAQGTSTEWLKSFFAVFLILVALHRLSGLNLKSGATYPKSWLNQFFCFLIGLSSSLLGIGGGILMVPYLGYCGLPLRTIPPLANWCSFIVALTSTVVFMSIGLKQVTHIPYSTGYIYWPAVLCMLVPGMLTAPLGARLNYRLPVKQIQYLFIAILLCTAVELLI